MQAKKDAEGTGYICNNNKDFILVKWGKRLVSKYYLFTFTWTLVKIAYQANLILANQNKEKRWILHIFIITNYLWLLFINVVKAKARTLEAFEAKTKDINCCLRGSSQPRPVLEDYITASAYTLCRLSGQFQLSLLNTQYRRICFKNRHNTATCRTMQLSQNMLENVEFHLTHLKQLWNLFSNTDSNLNLRELYM